MCFQVSSTGFLNLWGAPGGGRVQRGDLSPWYPHLPYTLKARKRLVSDWTKWNGCFSRSRTRQCHQYHMGQPDTRCRNMPSDLKHFSEIQLKGASPGLLLLCSQPSLLRSTLLESIICSFTFPILSLVCKPFTLTRQNHFFFCFLIQNFQLWYFVLFAPLPQNALLAD